MISQFFINRPVFATVLSLVIVIVGGIATTAVRTRRTIVAGCSFAGPIQNVVVAKQEATAAERGSKGQKGNKGGASKAVKILAERVATFLTDFKASSTSHLSYFLIVSHTR